VHSQSLFVTQAKAYGFFAKILHRFGPKADKRGRNWIVRFVPILLQKSFCTDDHKFSEL
jgi:hypothetical protein